MTEYATAMGEYGLAKTLKYAAQEMPGFKQLMKPDRDTARSLNNVLAEHSSASLRLRPFIARFEDGYEMDMGNALQLSAQQWGHMVPYANAMKFVHHHQARHGKRRDLVPGFDGFGQFFAHGHKVGQLPQT